MTDHSIRFFDSDAAIRHLGEGLLAKVNALLASEMAPRDWPLRLYSRELLFSVAARRGWVEPDLTAF